MKPTSTDPSHFVRDITSLLKDHNHHYIDDIYNSKYRELQLYCCVCHTITDCDPVFGYEYSVLVAQIICYDCGSVGKLVTDKITFPNRFPGDEVITIDRNSKKNDIYSVIKKDNQTKEQVIFSIHKDNILEFFRNLAIMR